MFHYEVEKKNREVAIHYYVYKVNEFGKHAVQHFCVDKRDGHVIKYKNPEFIFGGYKTLGYAVGR